jgi:hypothetical protein
MLRLDCYWSRNTAGACDTKRLTPNTGTPNFADARFSCSRGKIVGKLRIHEGRSFRSAEALGQRFCLWPAFTPPVSGRDEWNAELLLIWYDTMCKVESSYHTNLSEIRLAR